MQDKWFDPDSIAGSNGGRWGRWLSLGAAGCAALLLSGCDLTLMNPKGFVGEEQKNLILTAFGLMLIVVVPVMLMTVIFAWRYRASNKAAAYTPDWARSKKIEIAVWAIPLVIILILGTITWRTTHSLDPRNPLPVGGKPMRVEVIALDWKWLFIYPEQGVATINELTIPVDRAVEFHITSATVMNSFFIPQLGSQIYAMAGMENRLHLISDTVGDYRGISANYSGHGFSDMDFTTHVVDAQAFDAWAKQAKTGGKTLDWASFQTLEKPTSKHAVTYYSSVTPGLYRRVLDQYMTHMAPAGHEPASMLHQTAYQQGE